MLTFAVVAVFFRRPAWGHDYPRVRLPQPQWLVLPVRVLFACVFLLTVLAGFLGAQDPYANLITTMVWVVWWVGLAFVCALVGDLWGLANPLRTLFPASLSLQLSYPRRLAAWPAVALFLCFAWAELVWRDNDVPAYLARAVLAYAAITWLGMFLYGRDAWLERGEAFSILFGVFGRFAPIGGRFELRPPGAGLLGERPLHLSMIVFVLLALASVTFDGFLETPLKQRVHTVLQQALGGALFRLSEIGLDESQLIDSVLLAAFALGFFAAYWLSSWAMVRLSRASLVTGRAAGAFVLTLVPIAVAYHLAHYFSLLLTAGQFIIPLASDPFGRGWNLFGTAGYKVDLGIVSPYVLWYGAVGLIVLGHVVAVVLAHVTAARLFGERALASQAPMLALMVAYTVLSLWILAQPIVG